MSGSPLSYLFNDGLNVELFGAAGDGFTDSTAAIQAALNAAIPGEQIVYIPSGTFVLSQTVTAPTGVLWYLAGTLSGGSISGGTEVTMAGSGSPVSGLTDWINVKAAPYGATGNGTTDDTAAVQAALTAAQANGGTVYFPAGNYKITGSGLTYSSSEPLRIAGDVAAGSALHMTPTVSASFTCLSITSANKLRIENLSILNDVNTNAFTNTNIAIQLNSVPWASLDNVVVQTGVATNRCNQGIVLSNCGNVDINACDIRAYVNPLYNTGTTAVVNCRATSLSANSGSGVNGASNILLDTGVKTVRFSNVTTNGGDYGLISQQGAGTVTTVPAFIFANDLEINNPAIGGIYLASGGEFWGEQVWCSDTAMSGTAAVRHGLQTVAGFQGVLYLHDSAFQNWSGHGVWLGAGSGISITDTVFGGNGQNATNTYDDLHVGSAVTAVTVRGNHFETDWAYTMGSNKPRSGVYIEQGVTDYSVSGNIFAPTGWGTGACQDQNSPQQRLGFTGNINGYNYKDASGTVALSAISTSETVIAQLQLSPYDMQPGASFRWEAFGQYTNGGTSSTNTFRLRAGTAGTTADQLVASMATTSYTSVQTAANIEARGGAGLSATGAAGTGKTWMRALMSEDSYSANTTTFQTAAVGNFNTTTAQWLSLTWQASSTANSLAVNTATLEKVV